jgi:hypothetical protein
MASTRGNSEVPADDAFLRPPGSPHSALEVGPDTGRMLLTYIVEAGQPLAMFTE